MLEQFIIFFTNPSFIETMHQWLFAFTSVVTAASAVTALTPSSADDRIRRYLLAVLNFLALNIGNAGRKDKDE